MVSPATIHIVYNYFKLACSENWAWKNQILRAKRFSFRRASDDTQFPKTIFIHFPGMFLLRLLVFSNWMRWYGTSENMRFFSIFNQRFCNWWDIFYESEFDSYLLEWTSSVSKNSINLVCSMGIELRISSANCNARWSWTSIQQGVSLMDLRL